MAYSIEQMVRLQKCCEGEYNRARRKYNRGWDLVREAKGCPEEVGVKPRNGEEEMDSRERRKISPDCENQWGGLGLGDQKKPGLVGAEQVRTGGHRHEQG